MKKEFFLLLISLITLSSSAFSIPRNVTHNKDEDCESRFIRDFVKRMETAFKSTDWKKLAKEHPDAPYFDRHEWSQDRRRRIPLAVEVSRVESYVKKNPDDRAMRRQLKVYKRWLSAIDTRLARRFVATLNRDLGIGTNVRVVNLSHETIDGSLVEITGELKGLPIPPHTALLLFVYPQIEEPKQIDLYTKSLKRLSEEGLGLEFRGSQLIGSLNQEAIFVENPADALHFFATGPSEVKLNRDGQISTNMISTAQTNLQNALARILSLSQESPSFSLFVFPDGSIRYLKPCPSLNEIWVNDEEEESGYQSNYVSSIIVSIFENNWKRINLILASRKNPKRRTERKSASRTKRHFSYPLKTTVSYRPPYRIRHRHNGKPIVIMVSHRHSEHSEETPRHQQSRVSSLRSE